MDIAEMFPRGTQQFKVAFRNDNAEKRWMMVFTSSKIEVPVDNEALLATPLSQLPTMVTGTIAGEGKNGTCPYTFAETNEVVTLPRPTPQLATELFQHISKFSDNVPDIKSLADFCRVLSTEDVATLRSLNNVEGTRTVGRMLGQVANSILKRNRLMPQSKDGPDYSAAVDPEAARAVVEMVITQLSDALEQCGRYECIRYEFRNEVRFVSNSPLHVARGYEDRYRSGFEKEITKESLANPFRNTRFTFFQYCETPVHQQRRGGGSNMACSFFTDGDAPAPITFAITAGHPRIELILAAAMEDVPLPESAPAQIVRNEYGKPFRRRISSDLSAFLTDRALAPGSLGQVKAILVGALALLGCNLESAHTEVYADRPNPMIVTVEAAMGDA